MAEIISVVVPTRNSAKHLRECLSSIRSQTYPHYELIIVDGYSTDQTVTIAREYGATVLFSNRLVPAARNLGFSKARGEIFVSIDSDMILDKNLFEDIVRSIRGHGALIIPEVGYGANFLSRCKDLEKRCYLGDPLVESARVFRPKTLESAGWYDESLHFAEDWDLHCRIKEKFSIGRAQTKLYHNTQDLSLAQDIKKSFGYGKTLPRYLAKKSPQSKQWMNPANFFILRHFGKLAKEPVHALGLLAIRGMEYSSGLAGFLCAKLGL